MATVAEPDQERISMLEPDVILQDGTVGSKRALGTLKDIAPTVLTARLDEDWRTAFTAADALGRRDLAERRLEEFDADTARARARLGANKGAVTSVVRRQDGAPSVVGKGRGHGGATLAALGLRRPPGQRGESAGHSEPVSLEKLATIDGDWLFFGALGDRKAGERAHGEAENVANFTKLRAEREGHVVVVESSAWNGAGAPLAARAVLSDVRRALTPLNRAPPP